MSQLSTEIPDSGIQFELFFEPLNEKRMWELAELSRFLETQRILLRQVIHRVLP